MRSRSLTDDSPPPSEQDTPDEGEPEYTFEGFNVAFSEKIALLPPAVRSGDRRAQ
jgi:hypothetical protein